MAFLKPHPTTTRFEPVHLFGGAIVVKLPTYFKDVSDIRQVPDNQEVWIDEHGLTSISFDILQRVDRPDEEALRFHLADLAEEDGVEEGAKLKIFSHSNAEFRRLPVHTPAYTLYAVLPTPTNQRGGANPPDFIGLLLTLVRLEEQETDIIIAINVPHVPGEYESREFDEAHGHHTELMAKALNDRGEILGTFEIKDWSLFVKD